MPPTIFHIDVNSAFLSWTSVENLKRHTGPDLRLIPSIIGGDQKSRHGIVLAKSISAKKTGIYTSEPIVSALRKCPGLVIAPPDHRMYRRYSKQLMDYLKSLTPAVEQVSIDECYLDFSRTTFDQSLPVEAATEIKDTIFEKFGFTVNVGISTNKLLAKMASDFQKPNRVHTLYPHEIEQKMWPLPVEELYMAGRSSVASLKKLGIHTIGALARTDVELLVLHLKSHGRLLWEYANGIDDRPVVSSPSKAKGIGNSTTLSRDGTDLKTAASVLTSLAENVSRRLKKAGQLAGSISVEIKYHTFVTASHQMPLSPPSNDTQTLLQAALRLFTELWNKEPFRLLGIRTTHLSEADAPVQLNLFEIDWEKKARQKKLEDALSRVRTKYGDDVIHKGPS